MLAAHRCEYLTSWAGSSFSCVLKTLTNAFTSVCAGCKIKKALIRSGILHYRFGLSVDRKNERTAALFKLLQNLCRISSKSR